MDDFEKLINASDLIEWVMETYPDWCVGDVRSIVDHVMDLPSAQPEITDEQAIEHLQSTGWMQNHDREMYESGLREQLADASGSYDSLIPCEDTISRRAAIDSFPEDALAWDISDGYIAPHYVRKILEKLPPAEPEIIRCKDCRWWERESICEGHCLEIDLHHVDEDHYCSFAERRTNETD